jgi:hypothetical protein
MDPNANWEEQQRLAKKMLTSLPHPEDIERLCELVVALDEWARKGGFPPEVFQKK